MYPSEEGINQIKKNIFKCIDEFTKSSSENGIMFSLTNQSKVMSLPLYLSGLLLTKSEEKYSTTSRLSLMNHDSSIVRFFAMLSLWNFRSFIRLPKLYEIVEINLKDLLVYNHFSAGLFGYILSKNENYYEIFKSNTKGDEFALRNFPNDKIPSIKEIISYQSLFNTSQTKINNMVNAVKNRQFIKIKR